MKILKIVAHLILIGAGACGSPLEPTPTCEVTSGIYLPADGGPVEDLGQEITCRLDMETIPEVKSSL